MEKLKITTLDVAKLHHAEFGQFIIRLIEDFGKTSLDANTDADFKAMYDGLQAQIPTYNSALEQIRASEESKKIAEADQVRDSDVQALKDSIKPYRSAKTQAEKDAYTAVKIVLDQFKGVESNSYEEETNKLNLLTTKLLSADYTSALDTLGVKKFVDNLSASNTAFNEIFAHRSYQTSQKVTYNVKALRKTMMQDYSKMANYMVALANVKSDAFYKSVLDVINNSRKYYADVLARRNSTSNVAPTNPTPPVQ